MKKPLKKNAGGEASTMDFIVKKSNGGDVSRETSPKDKAPEVTGMNRVVDFIAQKLNPEWFPTSGRTLLETAQGVKTPITEKNFKSEELDIIRQLIALKGSDNGSITYGDYLALAQKLNKDGPPPTSITPGLYSMGDPLGNVHTTLGRFSYRTDPKGNLQVVDKYDFNPPMLQDMREARTGDYGAFGPYGMIREYAGEKIPPGTGRDVLINLGRIGQKARPVAKFAQGSPNPDEVPSVIDEREEIRSESQRMLNRLKAQGPRSTGFGNLPPGVAALKRDIEQRQIDAAKPGSAATMPLIDRPGMLIASDIVRGVTGTTPVEPTNPSEANRLAQALTGAYLPTAPVVRMGQSAKAAIQQPGATVASAKRGVEELGDTAAAQLARISQPNTLGNQAGIVRPPGGYFPTSRTPGEVISRLDKAFDPVLKEIQEIEDPERRKALMVLFNQKAKDFFTKQAGSIDDPLRKDILSGALKFDDESKMGDVFPRALQKAVAKESDAKARLQALRLLEKNYDEMLGIYSVTPRRYPLPETEGVVQSQIMSNIQSNLDKIPDAQLLAYAGKTAGEGPSGIAEAAAQVRQKLKDNPTLFSTVLEPRIARTVFGRNVMTHDVDMARFPALYGMPATETMVTNPQAQNMPEYGKPLPQGYFLPEIEMAIDKGQPIYDIASDDPRLLGMNTRELLNQARQMPIKELNKVSFPDFIKKAYANAQQLDRHEASLSKIKKTIQAGEVPPADTMLYGMETFLPTAEGFKWVKVSKPEAVQTIAAGMNNSVGSYARSTTYGSLNKGRAALDRGEAEIYALYDKNNIPHMTVEYLTSKASHVDPNISNLKNTIPQFTGNGPLTRNQTPSAAYATQIKDLVDALKPKKVPWAIQELLDKS